MKEIAFVSGHADLSKYEFECEYESKLWEAISKDHAFILGSAPGADTMALEFLIAKSCPDITVYLFEKNPENYARTLKLCQDNKITYKTGWPSYSARDKQMTLDSTYDIAWVRSIDASKLRYGEKYDPKKISGTQRNLERRKSLRGS